MFFYAEFFFFNFHQATNRFLIAPMTLIHISQKWLNIYKDANHKYTAIFPMKNMQADNK